MTAAVLSALIALVIAVHVAWIASVSVGGVLALAGRLAKSFTQQPALRMRMVPSTNTMSRCQPGKPSAAIHSALSVGHRHTSQPAGRSQRMRSRYRPKRLRGETADMAGNGWNNKEGLPRPHTRAGRTECSSNAVARASCPGARPNPI